MRALMGSALRHKQQYGIFVDGEAWMSAAFLPLDRKALLVFMPVHRLLRSRGRRGSVPVDQFPGLCGPHGSTGAGCASSRPISRSY